MTKCDIWFIASFCKKIVGTFTFDNNAKVLFNFLKCIFSIYVFIQKGVDYVIL